MNKWQINFESYSKGAEEIYKSVQSYVNYPIVCNMQNTNNNIISIREDKSKQGYSISAKDGNIEIVACDSTNLLYAASDFKNKFIPYWKNSGDRVSRYNIPFCDEMPDFEIDTKPAIAQRGIWTWGHVIYDYVGFIDNMVKLRLNLLIIWNDFVPINIQDVIDYAHKNGIKIYLGFAWGWDQKCAKQIEKLTKNLDDVAEKIAKEYASEYAHLDCDGIYFQTFTELSDEKIGDLSIADEAIKLVNNTAKLIYEITPDRDILFGLHATSVKTKLDVIAKKDPKVTVMWEDLGAFPYAYTPDKTDGFDETFALQAQIKQKFDKFASVLKGVACLDWGSFEHQQGPFIMGVSDEKRISEKLSAKKDLLSRTQAYWIKNAKYAHKIIKEFDQNDIITMLCEDCVFEKCINFPMAVYAQMLWNPNRDTEEILCEAALMSEVDFI